MNKKAIINHKEIQPGDMLATNAACDKLHNYIGYKPDTPLQTGVNQMVNWFMEQ